MTKLSICTLALALAVATNACQSLCWIDPTDGTQEERADSTVVPDRSDEGLDDVLSIVDPPSVPRYIFTVTKIDDHHWRITLDDSKEYLLDVKRGHGGEQSVEVLGTASGLRPGNRLALWNDYHEAYSGLRQFKPESGEVLVIATYKEGRGDGGQSWTDNTGRHAQIHDGGQFVDMAWDHLPVNVRISIAP